jgi:hypothetical protein
MRFDPAAPVQYSLGWEVVMFCVGVAWAILIRWISTTYLAPKQDVPPPSASLGDGISRWQESRAADDLREQNEINKFLVGIEREL